MSPTNTPTTTNKNSSKPLVIITGSSGLIGTRLIEQLSGDYRVVGLDVESPSVDADDFTFVKCDLTKDESVADALGKVQSDFGDRIASVVHLAAYYDFSGEPSPLYQDLTVGGTQRLLNKLHDFTVEQFIFSSTLLVMQSSNDGDPVTADSAVDAEWAYPQSKLETETLIAEQHGEIPALILRLAGVYSEDCHAVPLAQQIARIREKQLEGYFFPGDTTHGQSFIHLDDTIDCIAAAIARRGDLPAHEVLVIGEEEVMSYDQLQDTLGELLHGKQWPTVRIPKPLAKAGAWVQEKLATSEEDEPFIKPWMIDLADQNYPVNIRQAQSSLNWTPRHTLRETLPEMVNRLQADPVRWYQMNKLPLPDDLQANPEGSS